MVALDAMSPQVAVLGSLLIEPELIGQVMTQIRAEDFTNERCRLIYQAITGAFLEGQAVDAAIVCGRLGGFDHVGQELLTIMEQTPTAANVWEYVKLLKDQAMLSRLRDIGTRLEQTMSLEDALELVAQANGATSARPGVSRMSARELVTNFMDRHGEGKHPDYYTWSISRLDKGLYTEQGDFVILGGYPSAGKTALALRFAWHMAATRRVAFYSLETRPEKLADRSMATLAKVDMGAIKRSALSQEDWQRVATTSKEVADFHFDVIRAGGMTVQDVRADALAHRYQVIFVDYLQLISTPKAFTRTDAVTEISIGLHQLAQDCDITVVALSQLRRPEKTKNGSTAAPDMSSLRESGQLEQDADTIMLLYRENTDDAASRRVVRVAKNKEGTIGKIFLDFDGATQTFTESDTTKDVASQLSAAGRAVKNANRVKAQAEYQQMNFEELPDGDDSVPF